MKAPALTDKAVEWLKREHPAAIIVTEFSVADWGGAQALGATGSQEAML